MLRRGKLDWDDREGQEVLAKVVAKDWVVNVQKPPPHCQGAEAAINYLGAYVMGGPIGDGRMISDTDGMVTHRFKKYATDEIATAEVPGPEFVHQIAQRILPPRLARVRCSALFRGQGRRARLEKSQPLIDQAGLAPRNHSASPSATRLLGEEHDEDREESEEETSLGEDASDCPQCGKELKTKKSQWLDTRQALMLVRIVAGIVVGLRRDGESMLKQVVTAMLNLHSRRGIYLSGREFELVESMLVESMLVECLEDPQPLLRRYLGRHHPLIREAYEASARPALGDQSEPVDA